MYFGLLNNMQKTIRELKEENFDASLEAIKTLYDINLPNSFKIILAQTIYSSIISSMNDFELYFKFMKEIQTTCDQLIDLFVQHLLHLYSQESKYLLEKLINLNFVDIAHARCKKSFYFAHYKTKAEINKLIGDKISYFKTFKDNIEELSKNDWELHKKLIKEGINQNELSKIIRNDEIDKLQEISSQSDFDFNQTIEPSLYEICSFVNKKNVTLIDYAAYFGSVKCLKYLLMNNANVLNTGKYAVAGGNEEIIHLCEQNHSSFEGAYKTAIKFHRNDIFKYIHEKNIIRIKNLEKLGKKCIFYNNYEIFQFLEENGLIVGEDLIIEATLYGNIYLLKYFNEKSELPNGILTCAASSRNIEVVKYVIDKGGICLKVADIFL